MDVQLEWCALAEILGVWQRDNISVLKLYPEPKTPAYIWIANKIFNREDNILVVIKLCNLVRVRLRPEKWVNPGEMESLNIIGDDVFALEIIFLL